MRQQRSNDPVSRSNQARIELEFFVSKETVRHYRGEREKGEKNEQITKRWDNSFQINGNSDNRDCLRHVTRMCAHVQRVSK